MVEKNSILSNNPYEYAISIFLDDIYMIENRYYTLVL